MVFNDMDLWAEALAKCHLSRSEMPTSRGYLIENVECYNRIQQLLDTPAMEVCHKFLYNLDVEDLSEDEIEKVNELYKLGQDRGFIPPDVEEPEETPTDAVNGTDLAATDVAQSVVPPAVPANTPPTASYTVMYSAMKNGETKVGEAYSNSVSPRSAKADVLAKLARLGYDNIAILAIEATDPDCTADQAATGMNTPLVPPAKTVPEIGQVATALGDAEVDEDDILKGKAHNGHVDEADDKEEADSKDTDDNKDDKDDDKSDKADKDSDDTDKSDEETDDSADDESGAEDGEEDSGEEEKDKASSDEETDDDKLDDAKKGQLKDKYKKMFRASMLKCKFENRSFDDLSLEEKVDFFTDLSKSWKEDVDPSKFMTAKEIESLNKTVMKR